MNKKVFVILLLATVAAIIAALFISHCTRFSTNPAKLESTHQEVQDKPVSTEIQDVQSSVDSNIVDEKETQKEPVKQVHKSADKQKTVKPPKEQTPTKTNTNSQQEISIQTVDDVVQSGVYKDVKTNDIVITTEYKMASPAKYSFK